MRRIELGVEVNEITQRLGFTRNYWSAVENQRKILSEDSLIELFELFELTEEERRELLALCVMAKGRGWWTRYGKLLDRELQRLIGFEDGAESVWCYESLLIPGLLQTGDYARALISASLNERRIEVDNRVEVCLRRQLMHLARTVEDHPNVEVRIVPFTAKACGLFEMATTCLLNFSNPELPTLAWQERAANRGIIGDPGQVQDLVFTYRDALAGTLSVRDSLDMIYRRIKEIV